MNASASVPVVSAAHSIPWLPVDASWLSILQGCVPVAIATMVAWVGWRQLNTASAKLNLDLFDKRMVIFNATWVQIGMSARGELYEFKHLGLWFNKVHEAAFLFGKDIEGYFKEIREKGIKEQQLLGEIKAGGVHTEQSKRDEHKALTDWFLAEAENIQVRFMPYLSFEEWRKR